MNYKGGAPKNSSLRGKETGFTLAEVLITLGLLGVVIAMTLPALIQQHQKREITVALEKMYTTLMQAATTYQSLNDLYITDFDTSLSAKDFMEEYFNPFLNISMVCKDDNDCWYGKRQPKAIDQITNITIDYGVILGDGRILGVNTLDGVVVFFFDADGPSGYNRSGHDIFNFYLINSRTIGTYENCEYIMPTLRSGLYPGGYSACYRPFNLYSREDLLGTSIDRACNKNARVIMRQAGDACAALIMQDGWEMKKDYPAW